MSLRGSLSNEAVGPKSRIAASPDVSDRVSDFFERANLKARVVEVVRKRDGLVIDRRRMTAAEIERAKRRNR